MRKIVFDFNDIDKSELIRNGLVQKGERDEKYYYMDIDKSGIKLNHSRDRGHSIQKECQPGMERSWFFAGSDQEQARPAAILYHAYLLWRRCVPHGD